MEESHDDPSRITGLLVKWGDGDETALHDLVPLVHDELRRIARRCMAGERAGNSLQATALVNEAFVRLVAANDVQWQDRAHFLAVAARIMRRILVDHARARYAQKRGGQTARVPLDDNLPVTTQRPQNIVALDDALEALAAFSERMSRVVELRFFGGLSVEESAAILKVSPQTVMRDWHFAKAWLQREMRADAPES
jgi:RNA polymerase sigma-70 factor, ECF subfamily